MSKVVSVTRADVARAQLVIRLNESLGRQTAAGIRKIAAASPSGSAEGNGNGHVSGR